jgi:hypothetical protein
MGVSLCWCVCWRAACARGGAVLGVGRVHQCCWVVVRMSGDKWTSVLDQKDGRRIVCGYWWWCCRVDTAGRKPENRHARAAEVKLTTLSHSAEASCWEQSRKKQVLLINK